MDSAEFNKEFPTPETPPRPEVVPRPSATEATLLSVLGKRYSVEEIEACLIRFQGNQRLVSQHLAVAQLTLKKFLVEHLSNWLPVKTPIGKIIPALKLREDELKISVVGGGEMASIPDNLPADRLADTVAKENAKIRAGLITLGASKSKAEEMLSVGANFKLRHIDQAMGFAALGVAVNFTNQIDVLRGLEQRIKDRGVRDQDGAIVPFSCNAKGDPTEESMVLEAYVAISQECRRTAEFWMQAQLTIARIQAIKSAESKSRNGSTPPKGKVSFPTKAAIVTEV